MCRGWCFGQLVLSQAMDLGDLEMMGESMLLVGGRCSVPGHPWFSPTPCCCGQEVAAPEPQYFPRAMRSSQRKVTVSQWKRLQFHLSPMPLRYTPESPRTQPSSVCVGPGGDSHSRRSWNSTLQRPLTEQAGGQHSTTHSNTGIRSAVEPMSFKPVLAVLLFQESNPDSMPTCAGNSSHV